MMLETPLTSSSHQPKMPLSSGRLRNVVVIISVWRNRRDTGAAEPAARGNRRLSRGARKEALSRPRKEAIHSASEIAVSLRVTGLTRRGRALQLALCAAGVGSRCMLKGAAFSTFESFKSGVPKAGGPARMSGRQRRQGRLECMVTAAAGPASMSGRRRLQGRRVCLAGGGGRAGKHVWPAAARYYAFRKNVLETQAETCGRAKAPAGLTRTCSRVRRRVCVCVCVSIYIYIYIYIIYIYAR